MGDRRAWKGFVVPYVRTTPRVSYLPNGCVAGCGVRCRAGSIARRGAGSSTRRRTADLGSIVALLRSGVAGGRTVIPLACAG